MSELKIHCTVKNSKGAAIHLMGTRGSWRVVECRADNTIKSSISFNRKCKALVEFNRRKKIYQPMPQDIFPKEKLPLKRWRRC